MKNLKSYVFLLALCLLCGQGYATVRMFVAPEGKRLFICEYTNASPDKVEIPSYFMINDNNIETEVFSHNWLTGPVGPIGEFVTTPSPIFLDAYQKHIFTLTRENITYFYFLKNHYTRCWWILDEEKSNSVYLFFPKRDNNVETPNLDLTFLTKGTNVVIALGYLFDLREEKWESGTVLFLCYNGSDKAVTIPHPFGEGSTLEFVPRCTDPQKETVTIKGTKTDGYESKTIEPGGSGEWKCSWEEIKKRMSPQAYDRLRKRGFMELHWRIHENNADPFPLWIE